MALWYGWIPSHLPSKCECGKTFSVEHALSCSKSGFPTLWHNEIWDITASLLTEVCSEVCVESDLQPVTSDQLNDASANSQEGASGNSQEGAKLDVSANGVWGGRFQKTYFDGSVQSLRSLQQKLKIVSGIQKTWTWEETCVPAEDTRGGALLLHSPCSLSHRRYGKRSKHILYAPGIIACCKMGFLL